MELNTLNIPMISGYIKDFNIDGSGYNAYTPADLGIEGDESNIIYFKGDPDSGFKITFSSTSRNCKIFIGNRVGAVATNVVVGGSRCVIYFGDGCRFKKGSLSVCDDEDSIIIGNNVTTMPGYVWTTGHHSGTTGKVIVIGDDCMFSNSITIRASDGHPVFNVSDKKQVNSPLRPVIIEPHCWIGQAAIIMKGVKIGACSIVAAGSVVTKSCRRYSLMSGVPARRKGIEGKMWARNQTEAEKAKALKWCKKYPEIKRPLSKRVVGKFLSIIGR